MRFPFLQEENGILIAIVKLDEYDLAFLTLFKVVYGFLHHTVALVEFYRCDLYNLLIGNTVGVAREY